MDTTIPEIASPSSRTFKNVNLFKDFPTLEFCAVNYRTPQDCTKPASTYHQAQVITRRLAQDTVQERHRKLPPRSTMHATTRPRELRLGDADGLVPDLEDAVPRTSGNCHAVVGDTETAHAVVMSSQHT